MQECENARMQECENAGMQECVDEVIIYAFLHLDILTFTHSCI